MAVPGATTRLSHAVYLLGPPNHNPRLPSIVTTDFSVHGPKRLTSAKKTRCRSRDFSNISKEAQAYMPMCTVRIPSPSHIYLRTLASIVRATSGPGMVTDGEDAPVSLGTLEFGGNVDLKLFQALLFQWANDLTQNANIPLPTPLKVVTKTSAKVEVFLSVLNCTPCISEVLKVDKTDSGLQLSCIRVNEGAVETLVSIDISVTPGIDGRPAVFQAVRSGPLKAKPPPGEAEIMLSLKSALIKSLEVSRIA